MGAILGGIKKGEFGLKKKPWAWKRFGVNSPTKRKEVEGKVIGINFLGLIRIRLLPFGKILGV